MLCESSNHPFIPCVCVCVCMCGVCVPAVVARCVTIALTYEDNDDACDAGTGIKEQRNMVYSCPWRSDSTLASIILRSYLAEMPQHAPQVITHVTTNQTRIVTACSRLTYFCVYTYVHAANRPSPRLTQSRLSEVEWERFVHKQSCRWFQTSAACAIAAAKLLSIRVRPWMICRCSQTTLATLHVLYLIHKRSIFAIPQVCSIRCPRVSVHCP
jgi:hypothetical protein